VRHAWVWPCPQKEGTKGVEDSFVQLKSPEANAVAIAVTWDHVATTFNPTQKYTHMLLPSLSLIWSPLIKFHFCPFYTFILINKIYTFIHLSLIQIYNHLYSYKNKNNEKLVKLLLPFFLFLLYVFPMCILQVNSCASVINTPKSFLI